MANFYKDNLSIKLHTDNPQLEKIATLKENYQNPCKDKLYDFDNLNPEEFSPKNYEDIANSYDNVLEICGEIAGDIIAPNAEDVDLEGPTLRDNQVFYAKKTYENLKVLQQAGLMGFTLPRKYGGLNFPHTIYSAAIEIISRADASLMNLFGLQDIAETIKEAGNDDLKKKYLHQFASGKATGAMILTEPDAGSDLQAVNLKAIYDKNKDQWYLNGVKRFITNGNADISLVLARSEEGSKDGRGLSMFIYEKDETISVRRIENKLGIHGSPTCELVFKNSPAILVGKRRMGLIKYVMSLMNGARLGVTAQSVGICEAAYREAYNYAKERAQFGKLINQFAPVAEMIGDMKAKTEAARALLYETSILVDIYKSYEDIERERKLTDSEKQELKKYKRESDFFTPLAKLFASEYANQITYDALQVHGGSGFTKDYPIERLYRDARITNIYEGTSQLQVVAAVKGVTSHYFETKIKEYEEQPINSSLQYLHRILKNMRLEYQEKVQQVLDLKEKTYTDYHARRMVEMAGHIIMGHLLIGLANRQENFTDIADIFIKRSSVKNQEMANFIQISDFKDLGIYQNLAN